MPRPAGICKRRATFVPSWMRDELNMLSKADLMEVAYDLAVRCVGEDKGECAAYTELRETAGTLARCAARKEPRLQRGPELAAERGHDITKR